MRGWLAEYYPATALNSHHCLKLLAMVAMTLDHVGAYLFPDILWLRAVGRLAMPIFLFLVGNAPSYRVRREVMGWALVAAVCDPLLGQAVFPLNILVTILGCQWVLGVVERRQLVEKEPFMLCLAAVVLMLPAALLVQYGTEGLLFALMGYAVRQGAIASVAGRVVMASAVLMYLAFQLASLEYDLYQQVWILVSVVGMTVWVSRFKYRPVQVSLPPAVISGVIFLSRHSLEYYVIHRVLLQLLGLVLGVSPHEWHWFEV